LANAAKKKACSIENVMDTRGDRPQEDCARKRNIGKFARHSRGKENKLLERGKATTIILYR
jgi:hypothetical protein